MHKKIAHPRTAGAAVLFSIVLVTIIRFAFGNSSVSSGDVKHLIKENTRYKVSHVVDGDTFSVSLDTASSSEHSGQTATIRVLGINTPETVDPRRPVQCYGPEASAEAKRLLTGGTVSFAFSPDRELTDKYGRYLAYVYMSDGLLYNEYMIEQGFAREYTVGSAYSLQSEFRAAQAEAKKAHRGLWSACPNMQTTKSTK